MRFIARTVIAAALLALPALGSAHAALLFNGGFDAAGAASPDTSVGPGGGLSAAAAWTQFTVVPGGSLTTTLGATTDPMGSGNMLGVSTDSGDWPAAEQGNGIYQPLTALVPHAVVSFDLLVVSGFVTGGLTQAIGSVGVFTSFDQTFGPTGGWIHVTETQAGLSEDVAFETLTYGQGAGFGAVYYLDNLTVTDAPEPASAALLVTGALAMAGMARRRAGRR